MFEQFQNMTLRDFKISRSSRPKVFCKKGVLRNFTKFTGKHLCQSLFFNKVAGLSCRLEACNFNKKESLHTRVDFAKNINKLKTTYLKFSRSIASKKLTKIFQKIQLKRDL